MNANIVIKLNDGQSFVFGQLPDDKWIIGSSGLTIMHPTTCDHWDLEEIKEIHIKPMPTPMEDICHSVLGIHRHD